MAEKTTLSRPYAEAIFDIASQSKKSLDQWTRDLAMLLDVIKLPEVASLINNPEVSTDDAIAVLNEIAQNKLSQEVVNFLTLAGHNKRLELLPYIVEEFENLKAKADGSLEAEVISAYAVSTEQKNLITENLKKRFNKDVTLKTSIDKSLLGGIVIRAGDLVIDGSVTNQLQKITHTLMR